VAVSHERIAPGAAPLAVRMASALARVRFEDLDAAVVAKAKLCIFDLLASALTARDLPWAAQAASVARRNSGGSARNAAIIGTPDRVGVHDAAFANGVMGHGLVRDDMHLGSVSHLGTVLVPTLLALAETRRASGRDFLTALVAGYEIGGKIGRMILDVDVAKVFRPTGICGPMAGAGAGAKLCALPETQTATALALAANMAAGYNEWAATGGSEMFFHVGLAARGAVSAVELAAEGAYASRTAIDGEAGLLAAFHKTRAPSVPEPFTDRAEILAVFFKPVPACNYAQSPAQAAYAIALGKRLKADEIERVTVRVTRAAALYPGCDVSGPFEHVLQAKMSIHYNVAAALLNADFAERNYVPEGNPAVLRIAKLTEIEIDDELTRAYPAHQGAEVIVETRAGERLAHRVADVVPVEGPEVEARFDAAASERLGRERATALHALIATLETAPDAAELVRLTQTSKA